MIDISDFTDFSTVEEFI
jgi:hypothetical protein